jgi:hypothetical protein
MNYGEFKQKVIDHLADDGTIVGAEKITVALIARGVADLIDHIPQLRPDLVRSLAFADQIVAHENDKAGLFDPGIPPFRITEMWVTDGEAVEDADPADRLGPYRQMKWSRRFDLLYGSISECSLVYCVHPDETNFYVHPLLDEDQVLQVHYECVEPYFPDDAKVAFGESISQAVSDFVKAKLALDVERDKATHDQKMADFFTLRRQIYSRYR